MVLCVSTTAHSSKETKDSWRNNAAYPHNDSYNIASISGDMLGDEDLPISTRFSQYGSVIAKETISEPSKSSLEGCMGTFSSLCSLETNL